MKPTLPACVLAALCAQTANAAIIYTLPPQPISVTVAQFEQRSAPLDLDNDGVPEFILWADIPLWIDFTIQPARPGVFLQHRNSQDLARLPAGVALGPPDACTWGGSLLFFNSGFVTAPFGEWEPGLPPAFFGVKFDIGGQSHFGWVRAQLTESIGSVTISVFDYAYESVPNAPITTGAIPAPGAAVLMGISAMAAALRRRRP